MTSDFNPSTKQSPAKMRWTPISILRIIFLLILCIAASALLCAGIIYGAYRLSLNNEFIPPGYSDWGLSYDWNRENIDEFLGISIPVDATNLKISGRKGGLGQAYGFTPTLEFSFHASPATATAFAKSFCNGRLYVGYNPLIAVATREIRGDRVLVHARESVFFSHSPGVPQTTVGNYCNRYDTRLKDKGWAVEWDEKIALDMSRSGTYQVFYRLGSGYSDDYPGSKTVDPAETQFPLHVAGLQDVTEGQEEYLMTVDRLCMEVGNLLGYAAIADNLKAVQDPVTPYQGALVSLTIDGTLQPKAIITDRNALIFASQATEMALFPYARWNYCLDLDLKAGTHTAVMTLFPKVGIPLVLTWSFEVAPENATN